MSTGLKLIKGSYPLMMSNGAIDIIAAPENLCNVAVDAVAFEEDTYLVLSADRKVRDPQMPLMKIMTNLIETRPETPGSVLVKGKNPTRLLAIVHDLNQDPTWREEWIKSALDGILQKADSLKFQSVAIPFLGTLHGSLEKQRFVELFSDALKGISPKFLKHIRLIVPVGTRAKIFDVLRSSGWNGSAE